MTELDIFTTGNVLISYSEDGKVSSVSLSFNLCLPNFEDEVDDEDADNEGEFLDLEVYAEYNVNEKDFEKEQFYGEFSGYEETFYDYVKGKYIFVFEELLDKFSDLSNMPLEKIIGDKKISTEKKYGEHNLVFGNSEYITFEKEGNNKVKMKSVVMDISKEPFYIEFDQEKYLTAEEAGKYKLKMLFM